MQSSARNGFFREAKQRARDGHTQDPDGPWFPFVQGVIAHREGKLADAKTHYEEALKRAPKHADSIAGLNRVKAELGEHEGVQAALADLSAFTDWQSLVKVADTVHALQEYADARGAYDRALGMMAEADEQDLERVKNQRMTANAWVESAGFYESVKGLSPEEQLKKLKALFRRIHPGDYEPRFDSELGTDLIVELRFEYSKQQFLQPLQGFPLRSLVIHDTRVTDIEALKGMPLESLAIITCKVSDIAPLAGMPLRSLRLRQTLVSDLSPLRESGLNRLDIHSSEVSDLTPLQAMPLTYFNCGHSKVRDLLPLGASPLERLEINNTGIKDLRVIGGLQTLTHLNMYGTSTREISALADLPLVFLNISANHIQDLSPLRGLPLERLESAYNKYLEDLTPLDGLPLKEIVAPKNDRLSPESLAMLERMSAASCAVTYR